MYLKNYIIIYYSTYIIIIDATTSKMHFNIVAGCSKANLIHVLYCWVV